MNNKAIIISFLACLCSFLLIQPSSVRAHCDGLDGPVVKAAMRALETGNVNLVLIWIQEQDEEAIKEAFKKTVAVRKLSPEAKDMADMYFFETLVRIHRAGEGAPYTGLKPAGRDLGPAIPAVDKALEDGSVKALVKLLTGCVSDGVLEHFKHTSEKKKFNLDDVGKGREFVKAYVEFVHYVERIYEATQKQAHGHFLESEESEVHK
jgi:hypothetical protein